MNEKYILNSDQFAGKIDTACNFPGNSANFMAKRLVSIKQLIHAGIYDITWSYLINHDLVNQFGLFMLIGSCLKKIVYLSD